MTVTIPALYGMQTGTTPAYSVNGGTLQLNGLPKSSTGTVLTLSFNQPISGVGLNTETTGRFRILVHAASGRTTERDTSLSYHGAGLHGGFVQPADAEPADGWVAWYFVPKRLSSVCGRRILEIAFSNIRVQSSSAPDPARVVPTNGLQQWLRADQAFAATDGAAGGAWQDQSGQGHTAPLRLQSRLFLRPMDAIVSRHGGSRLASRHSVSMCPSQAGMR